MNHSRPLDCYVKVVEELVAHGVIATLETIRNRITTEGPFNERQITDDLHVLVSTGRLIEGTVFAWSDLETPKQYVHYLPPR